ncbi:hypothetical protein UPYG_G00335350 [Umbra pygmaea]|uniref:cAMP-regulated phosphoprotein 21-like n=1 Tax=Umbra pygmaea TaxID=75934 RepID=A0ABD0W0C1_UMBPY
MSDAVVPESSGLRSCEDMSSSLPLEEEEGLHDNRKVEQKKWVSNQGQPTKKRSKAKGKLVRSMAVYDDSSVVPPPDTTHDSQGSVQVAVLPGCHDNEEEEQSIEPNVPTLIISDTSKDYTDSTGIDLHQFIVTTLNSNPRDKMMLLKLEQEMIDFITDNGPYKKFPHMSSYHRMLVHRVAAYFGMEHNVDQTGKSVIINSTSNTRIPEQRFMDYVHDDRADDTQWRTILKRDNSEDNQARLHPLREEKRSKSMEEREEEYQRARERIFNQELICSEETRPVEECSPHTATQRRRQLFRGTRGNSGSSRQSSSETDFSRYSNWSSTDSGRYSNDPRPWSSTDSDSSHQRANPAPKARSANHSWEMRDEPLLNTSSNYLLVPMENGIPPGSILMNPHTGQPFLNPDGSPAIYNPPDPQQPTRCQAQQHAPPPPPQQPMTGQAVPQVVPYSSYPPRLQYSTGEELSSQFGCMTVSCQSAGEAPPLYPPLAPPTQSYVYTANPLPLNTPNYCQPPPTQVPVYYYSTAQCPTSVPATSTPTSQLTGYSTIVTNQQQNYPGVMSLQLAQNQTQSMLGTPYAPGPSHSCGVTQGGIGMSNSQSGLLPGPEGGYCFVVSPSCPPPPPVHTGCHASSVWAGK